jgi:hypothetical protein
VDEVEDVCGVLLCGAKCLSFMCLGSDFELKESMGIRRLKMTDD